MCGDELLSLLTLLAVSVQVISSSIESYGVMNNKLATQMKPPVQALQRIQELLDMVKHGLH